MTKKEAWENFKKGFITGLGSAFGATVGFAIVASIIVFILDKLGGLPLIGEWIASIVDYTQNSLENR